MIQFSQRNSEHDDIYTRLKISNKDQPEDDRDHQDDPFLKIKEGYSLPKEYEIYLETEKRKIEYQKKWNQDPMELVADKLRKAEDLSNSDLRVWVTYNFLALPTSEQEQIKTLSERQQWFWNRISLITPPLFYGIYAVAKYQLKARFAPAMIVSIFSIVGLIKLGLVSSNRDINANNRILYERYKDEVTNPKYRGLKLYHNKKAYQVDNKEFTTSNFDDLKQLVMSQINK